MIWKAARAQKRQMMARAFVSHCRETIWLTDWICPQKHRKSPQSVYPRMHLPRPNPSSRVSPRPLIDSREKQTASNYWFVQIVITKVFDNKLRIKTSDIKDDVSPIPIEIGQHSQRYSSRASPTTAVKVSHQYGDLRHASLMTLANW